MGIWNRMEQLVWREAVELSPATAPVISREAAGVPAIARKAMRFILVGAVATMLTAQVSGTRLVASVDASAGYALCLSICDSMERSCKCAYGPSGNFCRELCSKMVAKCRASCQAK